MPWFLDPVNDPAPRRIELKPGHTVTIGRTDRATESFADDQWMSSLHFAVGLSGGSLRLRNMSATNGTEVNGQRTEAAVLQPGDRIKAGGTSFVVIGPAASPYPAQMRMGGWGFERVPQDWQPIEGVGFQLPEGASFQATVSAVEEPLPEGKKLAGYVQTQMDLARDQLKGATLEGPVAVQLRGSEESLALTIKSATPHGEPVIQRQIYVTSGGIVGVFTATLLVSQAERFRDSLSAFVRGLSYFQG